MNLQDFCGLDFGTSNSTIGIFDGTQFNMVPLEDGRAILRSAIFFDYDTGESLLGQRGVNEYLNGAHGRLMMSLKTVLGSSLMQEETYIHNRWVPFTDILGYLIRYMKQQAEQQLGCEITRVVMGRPVHFHDHDEKRDRLAQDTLEKVARAQGFKTVLFQYEPIAAALAYEATITKEQIALIVDLGGGTSDFSVTRLRPGIQGMDRLEDVLANQGIHIGGTDFDRQMNLRTVMPALGLGSQMHGMSGMLQVPNSYYHDLTTWHTLNSLYNHKTQRELSSIYNFAVEKERIARLQKVIHWQFGHKILNAVEEAKCALSQLEQISLDLNFIEPGFTIAVQQATFENIILDKVEDLTTTLLETVSSAGVQNHQIDSIFFTGGSTQIPLIRQKINEHFPQAKKVRGDVFSSVGKGLIIDAHRKFR